MEAKNKTGLEDMNAMDLGANLKEIEVIAEHQLVCNEEAAVETRLLEHWRTVLGSSNRL
jgi:hypothetical protein